MSYHAHPQEQRLGGTFVHRAILGHCRGIGQTKSVSTGRKEGWAEVSKCKPLLIMGQQKRWQPAFVQLATGFSTVADF